MLNGKLPALLLATALFGFGCAPSVLRQDVPVSTNPMGAKIYANGQLVGQTPSTVSLERNRDHILTLVREDYRQADVIIKREYQSDKVLLKAIGAGVNAGTFFKDAGMGLNSGFSSISRQEESGEAYLLVPRAVKVNLVPVSAPSTDVPGDRDALTEQPGLIPRSGSPGARQDLQDALEAAAAAVAGATEARPVEKK